jgi:L-malate glycosyltransferase
MRYVLIGDGDSPHLLKWARALAAMPGLELWAASSRGFAAGFDALVPAARRLALNTQPHAAGGNLALLRHLPRLARWLRGVDATWLHAHYLTSHGSMAWLAQTLLGVRGRLIGSAWGSDILVTPQRSALMRWLTRCVLRHCALTTSDSQVMAEAMRKLGAHEVMVFPFGLEHMPAVPPNKQARLFFANRGLEPIYAPERVISLFAQIVNVWPDARLVVANSGSLLGALQAQVAALGLAAKVQFVGRLNADEQARYYDQAQWYVSLPKSDSVAVSVLEAMAHGCVPLLSDLPANRELVVDGDNGALLCAAQAISSQQLNALALRAPAIAQANRAWVQQNALFAPCVQGFLQRLRSIAP